MNDVVKNASVCRWESECVCVCRELNCAVLAQPVSSGESLFTCRCVYCCLQASVVYMRLLCELLYSIWCPYNDSKCMCKCIDFSAILHILLWCLHTVKTWTLFIIAHFLRESLVTNKNVLCCGFATKKCCFGCNGSEWSLSFKWTLLNASTWLLSSVLGVLKVYRFDVEKAFDVVYAFSKVKVNSCFVAITSARRKKNKDGLYFKYKYKIMNYVFTPNQFLCFYDNWYKCNYFVPINIF